MFAGETVSTLQFASRCKEVIVVPVSNEVVKEDTIPEELF